LILVLHTSKLSNVALLGLLSFVTSYRVL
jgi:hypothetical protein